MPPFAHQCLLIKQGSIGAQEAVLPSVSLTKMPYLTPGFHVGVQSRYQIFTGESGLGNKRQDWIISDLLSGNGVSVATVVIRVVAEGIGIGFRYRQQVGAVVADVLVAQGVWCQ